MLRAKYILPALILTCIWSAAVAGGGWVYKDGEGFFKLSQNMIIGDRFFEGSGEIIDLTPKINYYATSFYGEYGISDRFTGIMYAPVFVRSTINNLESRTTGQVIPGDEVNSIGDFDIGIKYGFFQDKPVVMAVSLTLGLPLGETQGGEGRILQTGDGEFNQLVRVEASHSFYPLPIYVSVVAGFNNRTNGFSDEFHLGGEIGYSQNKLTAILKLYSINSFYNGEATDVSQGSIFSNNLEYVALTPEVLYQLGDHFGVSASVGTALSGKRILAAPNWSAGVIWKL
jgi:hypothetical protein